jgi:spermidine/putrescine transport system ATP-binding protein
MEGPLVGVHNVTKRYGSQLVVDDVSLDIKRGEFFSLLGSSGCGKSTTLRMIAGFETPDAGGIHFTTDAKTNSRKAPAYVGQVNMVFQNYALFPHMTVAENVGFGLKMERVAAGERQRRVTEMLELVQLGSLGDRLPRQLSGGQQQRVALARALATKPPVVLLDEPLGALDLKLRKEMQRELKQIQESLGLTFIYVTHDQEEALTMSDRICVMNRGRVEQVGTPEEIYHRPQSKFVADFIGESNFLTGTVTAHHAGHISVNVAGLTIQAETKQPPPAGSEVVLAIRPERINFTKETSLLGQNVVPGEIHRSVFCGSDRIFQVNLANGLSLQVREQSDNTPEGASRGTSVNLTWPMDAVAVIAA